MLFTEKKGSVGSLGNGFLACCLSSVFCFCYTICWKMPPCLKAMQLVPLSLVELILCNYLFPLTTGGVCSTSKILLCHIGGKSEELKSFVFCCNTLEISALFWESRPQELLLLEELMSSMYILPLLVWLFTIGLWQINIYFACVGMAVYINDLRIHTFELLWFWSCLCFCLCFVVNADIL